MQFIIWKENKPFMKQQRWHGIAELSQGTERLFGEKGKEFSGRLSGWKLGFQLTLEGEMRERRGRETFRL